ncbi:transposase [Streptomyces sp. NPDC017936]|uniref:transposase n=1 Tax=Streptomyces sp. NPDC017936 TaxID=3365016 RepID=UPI0037B668B4
MAPPIQVIRPQGGGRRRAGDRECLAAVIFVAASGCTWRQLPPVFGPARPTVCRRFAQRSRERVRARLHRVVLGEPGTRPSSLRTGATATTTCADGSVSAESATVVRSADDLSGAAQQGVTSGSKTRRPQGSRLLSQSSARNCTAPPS